MNQKPFDTRGRYLILVMSTLMAALSVVVSWTRAADTEAQRRAAVTALKSERDENLTLRQELATRADPVACAQNTVEPFRDLGRKMQDDLEPKPPAYDLDAAVELVRDGDNVEVEPGGPMAPIAQ